MKKKIKNNLDLKILAVLFAIILWLIVVNIDDPIKTVQFSGVEVQILNGDELEAQGKVYEILDGTGEITVTVKGRRSIVEDISKENITAVADMKDLTTMNTLSIEVSSNKYGNELDDIKGDQENVRISIEDLKKVQKVIEIEIVGEPDDGYILGTLTTALNQIYLEGPESLIAKVSSARAQLDVDGVKANVSSSVPIKLYDKNGKEINDERISMNISTVSVNQEILMTKEVPVEFRVGGSPAEGYALTGEITSDINTVVIAGRKSVLDDIDSIVVPESVLDVDDLRSDLEVRVNLQDYLPGNVIFADSTMSVYTKVNVEVQKETFVTVSFSKADVQVLNLPSGYKAEVLADGNYLTNQETNLKVYGLAAVLEEYDEAHAVPRLDVSAYMTQNGMTDILPGIYNITPDFGLPEGAYIKDNFKIQVRITKES
ncbi:MAG: hypothetical protein J6A73_01205 [Lachnospiraceae bacterium]|nr:hypothetical protein [Lachnospiraceae bacterium]